VVQKSAGNPELIKEAGDMQERLSKRSSVLVELCNSRIRMPVIVSLDGQLEFLDLEDEDLLC